MAIRKQARKIQITVELGTNRLVKIRAESPPNKETGRKEIYLRSGAPSDRELADILREVADKVVAAYPDRRQKTISLCIDGRKILLDSQCP